MNARKCVHTRQRKAPLRGAWLYCRTAHAVQTRQAHHDNVAMASCTLVRAAVSACMSCDQKALTVCSLPARGQQQQPHGRSDRKSRRLQEADWTRSRCRISQICLAAFGRDSFPGFPEKEVGCGRRENARFGPSKPEFFFAGAPPLGLTPQTPQNRLP